MNKKILLVLVSVLLTGKIKSQALGTLPYEYFGQELQAIFVDSVHDKLIISSRFMNSVNNRMARGIASWDGTIYDSMSCGINYDKYPFWPTANGVVISGTSYNGQLLVGGAFDAMGRVRATGLALWDGIKWDSLPQRAFRYGSYNYVQGFFKDNNKLYVYGDFDTIAGQPAISLATYDGNAFTPVQIPISNGFCTISCMVRYQNELYIAGNIYDQNNPGRIDIMKFNGTSWTDVGGGIKGSLGGIGSMVIYNNDLYVGGYFSKNAGNAGNTIMRWNGYTWLNAGFEETFDNGQVSRLLVHQGKLYAIGNFNVVRGKKASNIAVFDGSQWCAYPDSLNNGLTSGAIYHDTIYVVGGFRAVNGDTSKRCLGKLARPDLTTGCTVLDIEAYSLGNNTTVLYPNPFKDKIELECQNPAYLTVIDPLGRTLYTGQTISDKQQIDLGFLSSGVYYLKVQSGRKQALFKLIKE